MKKEENEGQNLENEELENEPQDDGDEPDAGIEDDVNSNAEQDSAEDLDEEYLEDEDQDQDQSQISQIKSLVSKDPRKSMMLLVVLLLVMGGVVYYFFYDKTGSSIPTRDNPVTLGEKQGRDVGNISAPKISGSSAPAPDYSLAVDPSQLNLDAQSKESTKVQDVNNLNAPTKVVEPKEVKVVTPDPGPAYQVKPSINNISQEASPAPDLTHKTNENAKNQNKSARLKSSIMLVGGKSSAGDAKDSKGKSRDISHKFSAEASSAEVTRLTKIGNMSTLITQGKIIETVLETPVNTNYPGPIRALVSRDVYSELGENILIPKGSRVIGSLLGGYTAGHTRILLTWNRIILPSGYDIKVKAAPGVSKLGMIGIEGIVDRQLWNTLGNTVLLSALNVSLAKVMESEFGIGTSTTTTSIASDGTQTTSSASDPTQDAIKGEINNISSALKQWVASNFTTTPFITVDQGTVVKIFVNSDIQFPGSVSSGVNVLK